MRMMLKIATLFLIAMLAAACEKEGPAERAGEAIDEAADEIQDSGDRVADELEDSGEQLADAAEDACEEFKEGVDADNPNC
ncbi:MAG: hypothetical protein R3288_02200 [Woeseiaceae bacterium]|nr:hypothetical protein [Woeseiaceae bacterium]